MMRRLAPTAVPTQLLAAMSIRTNYGSNDPSRINHYDSKTYTRNTINTRVVIRAKPFVRSRVQKLWEWLRPTTMMEHEITDTAQIMKLVCLVIFPLFMFAYWKTRENSMPDQWEHQFAGLQNKPFVEEKVTQEDNDYFSIINDMEKRREKALAKKQGKIEQNPVPRGGSGKGWSE